MFRVASSEEVYQLLTNVIVIHNNTDF
jgi:hypothetical protein